LAASNIIHTRYIEIINLPGRKDPIGKAFTQMDTVNPTCKRQDSRTYKKRYPLPYTFKPHHMPHRPPRE